jgi:hypothetical protein
MNLEKSRQPAHDFLQWLASDWLVLRARSNARRCHHCREAALQLSRYERSKDLNFTPISTFRMHADSATNVH